MGKVNTFESSSPSTAQQSGSDFALMRKLEITLDSHFCRILDHLNTIQFELEYYAGGPEEEAISKIYYLMGNTNDTDTILSLKASLLSGYNVLLRHKISIVIHHLLQSAEMADTPMGSHNGVAYCYLSSHWIPLEIKVLEPFLIEAAYRCGINKFEAQSADSIKLLSNQFFAVSKVQFTNHNTDDVKINFANGTLVIQNGKYSLQPFDPNDFMRYKLDVDFEPKASCPMFLSFLDEVLPDKKSQMVLAEYLGYVFTKNLKLEKCLVLLGSGANGKGVIFEIVSAIFNDLYICSYTLSSLCDQNGYYRAALGGKLLNYSSELGGKHCDPDMIKKLISNEPIDARTPYGKPFELKKYCKFMFNTNTIPHNIEHTHAYFRRFMFVEFDYTVPEERRNPNLANQIIEVELSGIFNWILEGLGRLTEQKKFTMAPKIEATSQRIQKESNSVAVFMDDIGYVKSTNTKIPLKSLSNQYNEYCKENNYRAVSNVELPRRLKSLGYEVVSGTNNARMVYCEVKTTTALEETEALIEKLMKH